LLPQSAFDEQEALQAPGAGVLLGRGVLVLASVGVGHIQSVSPVHCGARHIPSAQVSPDAQSATLVHDWLHDCGTGVGVLVGFGVLLGIGVLDGTGVLLGIGVGVGVF